MNNLIDHINNYVELCEKMEPEINILQKKIGDLNANFTNNQPRYTDDHRKKYQNDQTSQYILLINKIFFFPETPNY